MCCTMSNVPPQTTNVIGNDVVNQAAGPANTVQETDQLSMLEARIENFKGLPVSSRGANFCLIAADFAKITRSYEALQNMIKVNPTKINFINELAICAVKFSILVNDYELHIKLRETQIARAMLDTEVYKPSLGSDADRMETVIKYEFQANSGKYNENYDQSLSAGIIQDQPLPALSSIPPQGSEPSHRFPPHPPSGISQSSAGYQPTPAGISQHQPPPAPFPVTPRGTKISQWPPTNPYPATNHPSAAPQPSYVSTVPPQPSQPITNPSATTQPPAPSWPSVFPHIQPSAGHQTQTSSNSPHHLTLVNPTCPHNSKMPLPSASTNPSISPQVQHSVHPNELDTFAYAHRLLELKKPPGSPYKGEPRSFNPWFWRLVNKINRLKVSAADAIEILEAHTKGAPQELIQTLTSDFSATPEAQFDKIQKELKRRFGHPRHVAEQLYETLTDLPSIKDNEPRLYYQIRKFSDTCSVTFSQMSQCPELHFLNSSWGLDPIRTKLPDYMIREWRNIRKNYMRNNLEAHPPFNIFCDFLKQEADDLCYDLGYRHTTGDFDHRNPECTPSVETVGKAHNPKCTLHPNGFHESTSCQTLWSLPERERKRLVFRNKLCFRCLSSRHKRIDCNKTVSCKICSSKDHPSILHFWSRDHENGRGAPINRRQRERNHVNHDGSHTYNSKNYSNDKWMYCRKNLLCNKCMGAQHNGVPCHSHT